MQKYKELIAKEEAEFTQRLAKELAKLANEGIGFYLPIDVVDHIADIESNLSFIKSKINKCAREGIEQGDGLNLFKVRRTSVKAEEQGQPIIKTEIIILVQCEFNDSHQAIYRTLNQTVATRLRKGVYVFDHDGCQYPHRTLWGEPIDTRLFANNARVNKFS